MAERVARVQRRTGGRPAPAAAPAPARWHGAALDLGLILVLWVAYVWYATHGARALAFDAVRDMAYAHGILGGRPWEDPSLPGLPAWYPPGNALLFAGLAAVTRLSLLDLYSSSAYWLCGLGPVVLYLLVRATWGRAAALLALPMTLLGSFWWLVHAAMPMPSVQGVALGLLTLLAWTRARQATRPTKAALAGILGAAALWHHPLCGAMALGAITLHGGLAPWLARAEEGEDRWRSARRAALLLGVAAALAAPLLVRQLTLPRLNAAPHHWFAPELHDPRFALHAHAPLVVLLGLLGVAWAARDWRRSGWLVGYFALGLLGQVAGYLGHDRGWHVPWALPHEFQWHEQLALAIAAALAAGALAERASRRWGGGLARRATIAALCLAAVGPALGDLRIADSYLLHVDRGWSATLATAAWVERSTPARSVFVCAPDAGYILGGLTGRSCIALPPGHMNPAADIERRTADLSEMLTTRDEASFLRLARRYRADYLLLDPGRHLPGAEPGAYRTWSCLEPAPVPRDAVPVYRILRERRPSDHAREAVGS